MSDDFIEHNGVIVKFTPDDTVAKEQLAIGHHTDTHGHRMAYYEVRYNPHLTDAERAAMMRRVKDVIK